MEDAQWKPAADRVKSKEDMIYFLEELARDFEDHQGEWENIKIPSFIRAAAAFLTDIDGFYQNFPEQEQDLQNPSWRVFAQVLSAAKVYE